MSTRVESYSKPLEDILKDRFTVDYYQRAYVWQKKQLEELITDLSNEFLNNWKEGDSTEDTYRYSPYYLGEIVLVKDETPVKKIIDGQQRITTLTLLFIYILRTYGEKHKAISGALLPLVYRNQRGTSLFNLEIKNREKCMKSLLDEGEYKLPEKGNEPENEDEVSVLNIIDRYADIKDCWNENINDLNIEHFTYWLIGNVYLTRVESNDDGFAYVIFETMNDRGLSLTQIEMLRSYLLANIDSSERNREMEMFDKIIKALSSIDLLSKSKAEFEFFKMYFRGHLAQSFEQSKNSKSDFVSIGKAFHRWVRDSEKTLGLEDSKGFVEFMKKLQFFANQYILIHQLIEKRTNKDYLYLVINNDLGFTLQPAVILSSICYGDDPETIRKKIKIVSKYLTKVLVSRIWNHYSIAQNTMENRSYDLCVKLRNKSTEELIEILKEGNDESWLPSLENSFPTLNQQNRRKIKVLLLLLTAIVSMETDEQLTIMHEPNLEIEHIWADHYERHVNEFSNESEFSNVRNKIGALLLLPKTFNASYRDATYEQKIDQYFQQNILARTLNENQYKNNPLFLRFIEKSHLPFKPYAKNDFTSQAINERTSLYREILKWHLGNNDG